MYLIFSDRSGCAINCLSGIGDRLVFAFIMRNQFIVFIVSTIFLPVFGQVPPGSYAEQGEPIETKITADTDADLDPDNPWKTWNASPYDGVHFDYYANESVFLQGACETKNIPDGDSEFSVSGIWAACQDFNMPDDCNVLSDCIPFLELNVPWGTKFHTVKLVFAVYGLGILRLTPGTGKSCFDYSFREDPLSRCIFKDLTTAHDAADEINQVIGWNHTIFIFDKWGDISFNTIRVELIARFKDDLVLLDKVEASSYIYCDNTTTCPTTTTTSRTTRPTTTTTPTTSTSTENPYFTDDPWAPPSRATLPPIQPSSSSNLIFFNVILAPVLAAFISLL